MKRQDFLDRFTVQRKDVDSDKTVLRDKTTLELILMRQITTSNHQQYKNLVEALEQQLSIVHPNLLCLKDYQFVLEGMSVNGPERKAVCYFQYSKYPLDMEISCRQSQSQFFEESELWGMLFSLVKVLSYLQKQEIAHGCLSTAGVFICEKSGDIKLCDPAMAEHAPHDLSERMPYSPELLRYLSGGEDPIQVNMHKNDVFVLGMCMLQASLLENCCDCYMYVKGIINKHLLNSKMVELRNYYSHEYCNMIQIMLNMDWQERPDFIEIEDMLREAGMKSESSLITESLEQMQTIQTSTQRQLSQPNLLFESLIEPTSPEIQQQKSPLPLLSTAPDTQNLADLQDYFNSKQEFRVHTIIKSHNNRSLIKTRSYQSLQSVRSVESKQIHPTACGGKDNIIDRIQYSIREFSALKDTTNEMNETLKRCDSKVNWSNYIYQPLEGQIFTDPALFQLIREDLNEMAKRRVAQ